MTKETVEMSAVEYTNYVLSGQTRTLKSYVEGKSYKLPAPYIKRTSLREATTLTQVRKILDHNKIWYQRIDVSGKMIRGGTMIGSPMKGMPDIVACYEGQFIGLELKAPGASVSCEQMAKLRAMRRAGARVYIVVNPERLIDVLLSGCNPTTVLNDIDVI